MIHSDPFSGVHPRLRTPLERRGFAQLTAIQQAVVANDQDGRDLRISSETGSGKTVALGLLLAPALADLPPQHRTVGPLALVITPTRELAGQVRDELAWLYADVPGVRVQAVTGGTGIQQERRQLERRPSLLVGTPGRLLDHLRSGALDCSDTQHVLLDEADQMLDMGFRDDLNAIVERLPNERHSHLVSATFPAQVQRLADAFQRDPVRLQGTRLGEANSDITHVVHVVRPDQRYAALVNTLLMAQGERCLVFVRRRTDAATVAEKLSDDGFSALPLSGDLAQAQRTRTLAAFRNGTIRTLVATDVAARGIDVADISVVIQGDLPEDADVYTHRSGRTGRAGRSGRSVLLTVPAGVRRVEALLRNAGVEAQWIPVPSPKKIRRALSKQVRSELHTRLQQAGAEATCPVDAPEQDAPTAHSPSAANLEYAETLLKEHDPQQVVASLLQMLEPKPICEPVHITPPAKPSHPSKRTGPRPQGAPPSHGGPRVRRRGPQGPGGHTTPRRRSFAR